MTAKARVVDANGAHTKVAVYSGVDENHLALAGFLTFSTPSWAGEMRAAVDALNRLLADGRGD